MGGTRLRAAVAAVRDGWLILGIALVMLVGLEVAYRGQGAVRRSLRGEARPTGPPPDHPYADQAWWTEQDASAINPRWDAYRGWWPGPGSAPGMTVDSAGVRRTVHRAPAVPDPRPVYMLGGSTMWGYTARDEHTIATLVEAGLHARGLRDVRVVNLAQSTYTLTQGLATLSLELAAGRIPAAAVFLDGNNEVATAVQAGEPGHVLNEDRLERRFERGSRGLLGEIVGLGRHSQLVARVGRAIGPGPDARPRASAPVVCPSVAERYERQARMARGVADAFGFEVVLLWQPLLSTSGKARTAWEESALEGGEWSRALRECSAAVDAVMAPYRGDSWFSLQDLFDDSRETVFIDDYGHVTEDANGVIADRIVEIVAPLLGAVAAAGEAAGPTRRRSSRRAGPAGG